MVPVAWSHLALHPSGFASFVWMVLAMHMSAAALSDVCLICSRSSLCFCNSVLCTCLNQTAANRDSSRQSSSRFRAQNYKNTEMNESRSGRQQTEQQQIQTRA
ncbi:hypothetical protein Tco_0232411 [Tanacetum coccineum]